jgi:toxin ParE1/3/4
MIKYRIKVSARAKRDFGSIQVYTLENYGKNQTRKYASKIEAATQSLTENPRMGREHNDLPNGYRILSVEKHSVIYTIETDVIHIIAILHESMLLEDKF